MMLKIRPLAYVRSTVRSLPSADSFYRLLSMKMLIFIQVILIYSSIGRILNVTK